MLSWESGALNSLCYTGRVTSSLPSVVPIYKMGWVVEKEMATHSSILAWKSPWTEEPGGLKSMGLHD